MPALLCQRTPADQVDYGNERLIVCKICGVIAGGRRFEMGDELPRGVLPPRALREIYDTPLRLVETMDYALADADLLAAMMRRAPAAKQDGEEEDGEDEAPPLVGEAAADGPAVVADGLPHKPGPKVRNKKK